VEPVITFRGCTGWHVVSLSLLAERPPGWGGVSVSPWWSH
jgi:hypothetical protein